MSELPSDLGAMLEAIEKYMGEQFTNMLEDAIKRQARDQYWAGRTDVWSSVR